MSSYPPGTTGWHLAAAGIIPVCAHCNKQITGDEFYLEIGPMNMQYAYHPLCAVEYVQSLNIDAQFEKVFYDAMDVVEDYRIFGVCNRQERDAALQHLNELIKNLLNLRELVEQVNANGFFKKPETKIKPPKNHPPKNMEGML